MQKKKFLDYKDTSHTQSLSLYSAGYDNTTKIIWKTMSVKFKALYMLSLYQWKTVQTCFVFCFVLVGLGFELGFVLAKLVLYPLSHHPNPLMKTWLDSENMICIHCGAIVEAAFLFQLEKENYKLLIIKLCSKWLLLSIEQNIS
jgi:hypothetical protein